MLLQTLRCFSLPRKQISNETFTSAQDSLLDGLFGVGLVSQEIEICANPAQQIYEVSSQNNGQDSKTALRSLSDWVRIRTGN